MHPGARKVSNSFTFRCRIADEGIEKKTHTQCMEVLFMKKTMKQQVMEQWEAYGKMLMRADLA